MLDDEINAWEWRWEIIDIFGNSTHIEYTNSNNNNKEYEWAFSRFRFSTFNRNFWQSIFHLIADL